MQAISDESDQDVRFDPSFDLVKDGPDLQIPFEVLESFFDLGELEIT
jgi:hypothetical protein